MFGVCVCVCVCVQDLLKDTKKVNMDTSKIEVWMNVYLMAGVWASSYTIGMCTGAKVCMLRVESHYCKHPWNGWSD